MDVSRPAKRQKVYRKRATSGDRGDSDPSSAPWEQRIGKEIEDDIANEDQGVSSLLRQRNLQRRGRSGITFNNNQTKSLDVNDSSHVVPSNGKSAAPVGNGDGVRFARETGQRIDDGTDKHMMAYIDSKLAQSRKDKEGTTQKASILASPNGGTTPRERKPTSSGKLQEIDLGPSATELNVQRTQVARQRLEGGHVDEPESAKKQRMRIGRDGKPVKPRKRFRRRSEDIERDKLIDSLMKEARLEVYEKPEEVLNGTGEDEAADERIAEAFRRDFLNQAEDKNVRKGPPPPPGPRGAKGEPDMKGPKLGGSRSARAAMRAQQEGIKR